MQNVCRRYGDPRPSSGPPGLYGLPVIHVATTSGRWGDDRAPQSRLPTGRTVHLTYQNRPGQTLAAAALERSCAPRGLALAPGRPGSRASRRPRICPVIPYSPPPGVTGTVNPQARAVCACDWSCGTAALPLQAGAEGQVRRGGHLGWLHLGQARAG